MRGARASHPHRPFGSPVYDGCYAGSAGRPEHPSVTVRGTVGGARAPHPPTFTPRPTSSSFLSFEFREVLVRVGVKVRGARASPSSTPSFHGSIADKFLFSSHCMSELVVSVEPKGG